MKEAAATRLTAAYFGGDSTTLGAIGGLAPLSLAQLPTGITSGNASQNIHVAHGGNIPITLGNITFSNFSGSGGPSVPETLSGGWSATASSDTASSISVTSNNTSGNSHKNVQPTIVCNYIMRVI